MNTPNPMTQPLVMEVVDFETASAPVESLKGIDAICIDLEACPLESDHTLNASCLSLIQQAEENHVEVILTATWDKLSSVTGLEKLPGTLIEKPYARMPRPDLLKWLSRELGEAAGFMRPGESSVAPVSQTLSVAIESATTEPKHIHPAYLDSTLSHSDYAAFLEFARSASGELQGAIGPVVGSVAEIGPRKDDSDPADPRGDETQE